ncbi:hypothetical protein FACS1894216_17050 [Synergistales bacterium]|nr:hypothetical protein FACS1894216_17050 [Synergistales bacterium]
MILAAFAIAGVICVFRINGIMREQLHISSVEILNTAEANIRVSMKEPESTAASAAYTMQVRNEFDGGAETAGSAYAMENGKRYISEYKKLYNGRIIGIITPEKEYSSGMYTTMVTISALFAVMALGLCFLTVTINIKQLAAESEKTAAVIANENKSSFLATMSHEIRTPMNAIIGISEMELMRGDLPERLNTALTKIYDSGHSLLGIINDILDLSKIEAGKLEITPALYHVPSMINDSAQLNKILIGGKAIEFRLDVSGNLPAQLYGDELRIKQILNNVLSNAFKYTDEGSVTLSVSHISAADGVTLIFKVADTGQGMKREQVQQLFNEYSRFNLEANRTTTGTGLGMSITRKLAALMNGGIEVESEYGKGSVFTISVKQGYVGDEIIGEELSEVLTAFSASRLISGSSTPF